MAGRKRADVTSTSLAAELARRLRALRDESHLTLRQLAGKSGFAASTLSLAESGRAVPSWDLLAAFVQSCGQDPAGWRQLWEVAHSQTAAAASDTAANLPAVETDAAAAAAVGQPEPTAVATVAAEGMADRAGHRRAAVITGTSVLAAAITAAAIVAFSLAGNARSPAAAAGTPGATPAGDSADPYAAGCKADEKQLSWQPVLRAGHTTFGTIMLMYSPACRAAWGYLDGPNSTAWTTHIIAHRIPGNATAPSQFGGDAAYGSWGNVLSTRTGCVYIEAYVTDRHGQGPHARTACFQP